MPDRSPKIDVAALLLGVVTLLAGVSLASYDRFDPPSRLAWPPVEGVRNACGAVGAQTAHTLLQTLGVGAYYALASAGGLTWLLLKRREIDQPILRVAGWGLSLVGFSTLATLLLPSWTPGPLVGAGGEIGALGRTWLEANFASAGAVLVGVAAVLAGLLLSTDYFLFRAAAKTAAVSATTVVAAGRVGQAAVTRLARVHRRTDLDLVEATGLADGKTKEGAVLDSEKEDAEENDEAEDDADQWEYEDADEEDEASDDEEWEYEDEEEEELVEADEAAPTGAIAGAAAAVGGIGKRLATALRVKTPDTPTTNNPPPTDAPQSEAEDGIGVRKPKAKSEREQIIESLEAADHDADFDSDYELPPIDLLLAAEEISYDQHEKEVRRKAKILEQTFANFGFNVKVVEVETGPVIAQYEVELEPGLRLSKITGLADDLAIALRAPSVRIVAPIPGKNTVGIEAPNDTRQVVRLREVIEETDGQARRMKIPIYLGKDVAGNPMVVDLAALPHLLIAGRTGTGKSVCLNSIIVSILMSRGPDEVRMLMIDPKMVELSGYRKLPHLMHPVVTDMKKAEAILAWAVDKMEERYTLLARAGVRHVSVYNQLSEAELRDRLQSSDGEPMDDASFSLIPKQLPFIVIVADEMADLMMTAGKDVEQHIIRLAQKSRAVGIHLILATQKPTVDVITGLIKSNLPARIAFQVASRTDSRVVLDEMGADKLLGNGDMLFLSPGTSMLLRGQGTYLSDDEISRVVDYVGTDDQQFAVELMQLKTKEEEEAATGPGPLKNRDELYQAAVDVVVRERRGSVSLLQRCLGIGYGRAARLIDFMAEDGIVGEYNGSQAREILITVEEWEAMTAEGGTATASPAVPVTVSPAAAKPTAPWEEEQDSATEDEAEAFDEEDEQDDAEEDPEEDAEEEDEEDDAEEDDAESEDDETAEEEDEEEWEYEEEDESEEGEEGDEEWEYVYEDEDAESEEDQEEDPEEDEEAA
ncbi:DNA translocase FtsK [Botrimarina hoheduenensis]|uniref:DNA translocase FtsK n=1 Tax=Botrimarina hoheduenensis TaxID=2528000 RepID=UPI001E303F68|nr:DNA translocase FtsK [Botrimarina hoheduenensis]